MNILITGTSGFIGSQLLKAICTKYGSDKVLALSTKPKSLCETILYDSRNLNIISGKLEKFYSVDTLLHAGAFTPKSTEEANFIEGCNSNIIFTTKLLNKNFHNLRRIIYLSTIDVYDPTNIITESTPTIPTSLYGHSKLYCENMIIKYAQDQNIDSQTLRIGHVFGPGEEKYRKFLPIAIERTIKDNEIELWNGGNELRSLIYINDVIEAILTAIEKPPLSKIINIVGGQTHSIYEIVEMLNKISGKKNRIIYKTCNTTPKNLKFDNGKMKRELLLRETDFYSALTEEYNYFKKLK